MSYQDNLVSSLKLGHYNGRSALQYGARGGGTSNIGLLCAIRPSLYYTQPSLDQMVQKKCLPLLSSILP
jgi:hypothetical protein